MSIPIGNALFEKDFGIKKFKNINRRFKNEEIINNLDFFKVDYKNFPPLG